MIEGKKNVEQWFEHHQKPYWIIYQKAKEGSGNPSYKSDDREGVTFSDAYDQLKKVLGIIGRGQYCIIAADKPAITAKGTFREDFEISINESTGGGAPSQVASIAGPQLTSEDIAAQVQQGVKAGIEAYKREQEMDNLKKELADLKKENSDLEKQANDPLNRIAGILEPYAPSIVKEIFPKAAQVAGLPKACDKVEDAVAGTAETVDLTPEQNERLSNALSVFAQYDTEWLQTLERMAVKLQSSPQLLTMIKSFL